MSPLHRFRNSLLCDNCYRIPWDNPSKTRRDVWGFKHYNSFPHLQQSADVGCNLCRVMWTHLFPLTDIWYDGSKTNGDSFISISGELSYQIEYGGIGERVLIILAKRVHEPRPKRIDIMASYIFPEVRGEAGEALGVSFKRLQPKDLDRELNELVQQNIRPWLTCCSSQHPDCEWQGKRSLPTRLIDVGSEGSESVRLVDTARERIMGKPRNEYMILSYCWGKGNGPARTTRANLQERNRGIKVDSLPKTIRDAIKLTRVMGACYLWVDAMCIVQENGDGYLADWNVEAVRMGSYYANAVCCIAASFASDSSRGFLNERVASRYPYEPSAITWARPQIDIEEPPGEKHPAWKGEVPPCTISPDKWELDDASSTMSRAWCFQEYILSPRILHWTNRGLFWQCRSSSRTPEGKSISHDSRDTKSRKRIPPPPGGTAGVLFKQIREAHQIFKENANVALGQQWKELVSLYKETNITYVSDRLPAMHSIARRLALQHRVKYFAGIFSSHTADGLNWTCPRLPQRNGLFPSWSWASVSTFSFTYEQSAQSLAHPARPDTWPSLDQVTDFRDRSQWKLRVNVPTLIELDVIIRHNSDMIDYDSKIWPGYNCEVSWDLAAGNENQTSSSGAKTTRVRVSVMLLSRAVHGVAYSAVAWAYYGLILQRSEKDKAYERIGLIRIEAPDDKFSRSLDKMRTEIDRICETPGTYYHSPQITLDPVCSPHVKLRSA